MGPHIKTQPCSTHLWASRLDMRWVGQLLRPTLCQGLRHIMLDICLAWVQWREATTLHMSRTAWSITTIRNPCTHLNLVGGFRYRPTAIRSWQMRIPANNHHFITLPCRQGISILRSLARQARVCILTSVISLGCKFRWRTPEGCVHFVEQAGCELWLRLVGGFKANTR